MTKLPRWLAVLATLLFPLSALAQQQGLTIDIVGGNAAATPIAVLPMPYRDGTGTPATDISSVVAADLNRSGQFRTLPLAQTTERPTHGAEIRFPTWQALKQDYIVVGRVLDARQDAYRVEYELFDVRSGKRMLGLAMTARPSAMRDVAHQMADAIYEKITGMRGAFWTRIAYVTASGLHGAMRYSLMVADSDGYNPQTIVRSAEPLLSPHWSPDGKKIAYVSFEKGSSSIYIQDIATGSRELVSSFRGINAAPSFAPDGRRIALSLSRSGNPEIYVMDLVSKQLMQLTNNFGIDTEPVWSPDGKFVYFTSDRGGRPQIYKVAAFGGAATRVTFQGNYNATASISYDGNKIVVAQGGGNTYRIAIMDQSSGSTVWNTLSTGSLDESPSFAPNASMVIYAAREGGRGVLYAVSSDARVRQRLVSVDSDVREPAWGPYRTAQQ
ncbi:MAG TPA: Tol-Pal system beta propeller repeat protein TolB [Xylella sp.]